MYFIRWDLLYAYIDIYALFPVVKYLYKEESKDTLDIEQKNFSWWEVKLHISANGCFYLPWNKKNSYVAKEMNINQE